VHSQDRSVTAEAGLLPQVEDQEGIPAVLTTFNVVCQQRQFADHISSSCEALCANSAQRQRCTAFSLRQLSIPHWLSHVSASRKHRHSAYPTRSNEASQEHQRSIQRYQSVVYHQMATSKPGPYILLTRMASSQHRSKHSMSWILWTGKHIH
jgi:hypothetical protein